MWETILGGALAILGGWGAIWFQFKNIRENRMNEIVAERKVTANAEAYSYTKEVQSFFVQSSLEDTEKLIHSRENWFFGNRLFLPGEFPAKWLTIRHDLHILRIWQEDTSKSNEDKLQLHKKIESTIEQAIDEIYKDMKQSRIKLNGESGKSI